jgi:ABC-type cobalamin transport system permease subunit
VGDVKAGGKNESAFTKFNSSFAPTWTLRLPSQASQASQGAQLAATGANGGHYALFNSTSSIPGVTGWKPTSATPIVIRFDSKGAISQALKSSQVKSATSMVFIAGVGLIVVSQTGIYKG